MGRPLALFRNLPETGIDVDILTVKTVAYRRYEPELLDGLPADRIYRAGSRDPQRILYMFGMRTIRGKNINRTKKIAGKFFPDPKIGWVKPAVNLGRVLLENKKYDLILSTSPPVSAHLVARQLAQEFQVPWIADFRDYWTSYTAEDWFDSDDKITQAKELLKEITTHAEIVTTANSSIAEYLGKGEVVYNSFDQKRAELWQQPSDSELLRIGVLGTIDRLCPIVPLIRLLEKLREMYPGTAEKIAVIQVGDLSDEQLEVINQSSCTDMFQLEGPLDRDQTVEILSQCHVMYLALDDSHGKGIVPGRIFDLIASGRPILMAANVDSELAALAKTNDHSIVFDLLNHELVQHTAAFFKKILSGDVTINAGAEDKNRFSSKQMAAHFVTLINRIINTGD